jgi:hypothetical protein
MGFIKKSNWDPYKNGSACNIDQLGIYERIILESIKGSF